MQFNLDNNFYLCAKTYLNEIHDQQLPFVGFYTNRI